jgi:hypothetical protein
MPHSYKPVKSLGITFFRNAAVGIGISVVSGLGRYPLLGRIIRIFVTTRASPTQVIKFVVSQIFGLMIRLEL